MQPHPCNIFQLQKCFSGFLFTVGFLSLLVAGVQCDDYLKEKPTFLKPCALSDPKNGECLAKALENVFTNWKDGIPGLKNLSSIDPLHVKHVHAEQNGQNIKMKVEFKDMVITGLSKTKFIKASVNKDYNFKFLVKIPLLRGKAKYRMKGTILLLNLNSAGSMEAEMSDADAFFSLNAKLTTRHNHKFFEITSLKTTIKNIGNFHSNYENLFSGSAELGESANAVFNENWRDIFETVRPVLEETLDTVAFGRYKTIFNYVPANYFFVDLP